MDASCNSPLPTHIHNPKNHQTVVPSIHNHIPLSLLGGLGLAGFGAFVVVLTSAGLGGGASGTPPMPSKSPIGAGDVLSTNDALSLPRKGE